VEVAIAETIHHDEIPAQSEFQVSIETLNTRYSHVFSGRTVRLIDLTGASSKRLAGHADLAATAEYALTHQWAKAIFDNPLAVDDLFKCSTS
jgi:hypothetical protein